MFENSNTCYKTFILWKIFTFLILWFAKARKIQPGAAGWQGQDFCSGTCHRMEYRVFRMKTSEESLVPKLKLSEIKGEMENKICPESQES